jgi:hypothetical protein
MATGWRVRRAPAGRGRPEVLYSDDGTPLVVSITATPEDLADAAPGGGRFRLDAVSASGIAVPGCPPAFVRIPEPAASEATSAPTPALIGALVDQTRLQNATIADLSKALVARDERLSEFLSSLATLTTAVERVRPEVVEAPAPQMAMVPMEAAGAAPAAEKSMLERFLEAVGPDLVKHLLPLLGQLAQAKLASATTTASQATAAAAAENAAQAATPTMPEGGAA